MDCVHMHLYMVFGAFTSMLNGFIPQVTPSQKRHKDMSLIQQSHKL
jgi:hypothetical protein